MKLAGVALLAVGLWAGLDSSGAARRKIGGLPPAVPLAIGAFLLGRGSR